MPFSAPFYYCGDNVTSFADVARVPSPIVRQMRRSFAPVLLSLELWQPHVSEAAPVRVTAHVVNDDDAGRDLASSTLRWNLTCFGAGAVGAGASAGASVGANASASSSSAGGVGGGGGGGAEGARPGDSRASLC